MAAGLVCFYMGFGPRTILKHVLQLRYYYNSEGLWSMSNLWYPNFDYYEGDIGESVETDDISALQRVLRYPLRDEPCVDTSVFISGYEYEDKMPSELDLKATYPLANLYVSFLCLSPIAA